MIDTAEEAMADTLFYVRHSRRIAHMIKNSVPASDPSVSDMAEQLESAYESLALKKDKNQITDKNADRLLKAYQKDAATENGADSDDENVGIEDGSKENAESRALEEFINTNHNNYAKISADFKLFEVVTAKHHNQVLRYSRQ